MPDPLLNIFSKLTTHVVGRVEKKVVTEKIIVTNNKHNLQNAAINNQLSTLGAILNMVSNK
ncbi:MAG: hypothetical protein COA57_14360 [Flavobacteriales bacterium]|nr:MAG: hypothetical protein COA57_14360 [Flavobacteriales bacterium]